MKVKGLMCDFAKSPEDDAFIRSQRVCVIGAGRDSRFFAQHYGRMSECLDGGLLETRDA